MARGRGVARSRGGRGASGSIVLSEIDSVPEFPNVVFDTEEQRVNFLRLSAIKMIPTRFLCVNAMREIGLHEMMEQLFRGTGVRAIYGISEFSYRCLTLEFLSSFVYTKSNQTVRFRMFARTFNITVAELGNVFRFDWDPNGIDPEAEYPLEDVWTSISGRQMDDMSKLRTNDVTHPALRLSRHDQTGIIVTRPYITVKLVLISNFTAVVQIMNIIMVLSLRNPDIAARAIEAGAGDLAIQAMQNFTASQQLQRNA